MKNLRIRMKGQGLIGAMVAASIVAGMGIYIAKISRTSAQVNRAAKNSSELNDIYSRVTRALFKSDVCTASLNGVLMGGDITVPLADHGILLAAGQKLPGTTFTTTSLKLVEDATDGNYYIEAEIEKDENDQSFGAEKFVKRFGVDIRFVNDIEANGVEDCFSAEGNAVTTAIEMLCTDLGGTFNPDTNRCEQDSLVPIVTQHNQGGNGDFVIENKDFCSLSGSGGEDGWKDSTFRSCDLIKNGDNWLLKSRVDEGRSNNCTATCFNLASSGNVGTTDGGTVVTNPPPGACRLKSMTAVSSTFGRTEAPNNNCTTITSENLCEDSYQNIITNNNIPCEWYFP